MELVTVAQWIYSQLTGRQDLMSLVNGRIFHEVAPLGTQYPVIVFQHQSGADVNGTGCERIMVRSTWLVRVIGKPSLVSLKPVADLIDDCLHKGSGKTQSGEIFGCLREAPFMMVEPDGDEKFIHLGGLYRIFVR